VAPGAGERGRQAKKLSAKAHLVNAALKDLLTKMVTLAADLENPIKLAGGFFPKPARGGHPIANKI
jgi:hypothetical protein